MDWNNELVLLLIIVKIFNCHSISIEAMGKAVVGAEYTIKCKVISSKVIWFKNKLTIGWSKDTYIKKVSDKLAGCSISNKMIYEFKRCGVKHELTIKSIDYERDNGVDWSCQSSSGRSTLTVLVIDQPRVKIEKHYGHLLCIAEGPYRKINFSPWKHSIDNKLVREIEGYYINTTVYSLNITNNQNNEGSYTCTVIVNDIYLTESYNIDLHAKPALYSIGRSSKLIVGQNGSFSLEFLQDNTVNVSWNRDGQKLENNSRVTISEEPTEISHPYNNNIKLSGIKTTLTITSIIITDQGNYTCDICNQYGCSHRVFELNVASLKKQTNEDAVIDVNTTIIVASVVSTVILICVVVVIFIAVLRRRTKSKGSPQPIITENDLYVSSDLVEPQDQDKNVPVEMEIIENDLYISSDSLDDENTKEPPVYTQVKKTKKTETTYENNVPSMKSDNFPEYGIVQKKKGEDKTTNHDKDRVYYNTSSEAVSSVVSDFDNLEPDPYINAEYLNRKQLEIGNS